MIEENLRIADFLRKLGDNYPSSEAYRRAAHYKAAVIVKNLDVSILEYVKSRTLRKLPHISVAIEQEIVEAAKYLVHRYWFLA